MTATRGKPKGQPLDWDQVVSEIGSPSATAASLPPGTSSRALDKLYPKPPRYLWDPVKWARDKMRLYLWSKQVEILEALKTHRMVAVQSCHGPGKSFTASVASAWWLDEETHPLGQAFLVTTAPSWTQVEAILWREIRRRWRQGGLGGRITLDCQWHMGLEGTKRGDSSEELIGMGRKPADYDDTTFQGIHARYFMAVLDEAGGIPESLWNSVLALVTNANARVLAIGNPDDPNSRFAQVCKPGSGWKVIKISVWDTPLFTGEHVPEEVAEALVSPLWVDDRRRDWGEGTPIWIAKVDGEFPDISEDYLFPPRILNRGKYTELPGFDLGRYSLDVARYGDAKTVVYRNRGGQIRFVDFWGLEDTAATRVRATEILAAYGGVRVPMVIDATGVGGGVYDEMRAQRLPVNAFYGAERARNPKKFVNRRSETYWQFREAMGKGLVDIDETDDRLLAQLGSIKWTYQAGTERIQVETKDDMKKRGLPSPDYADAAVMSTVDLASVIEMNRNKPRDRSLTGDLLTKRM